MEKEYQVLIVEKGSKIVSHIVGHSALNWRKADRVQRGVEINLNHKKFSVYQRIFGSHKVGDVLRPFAA